MPLNRRQILRRRRMTVFGGLALVLATGFYLPFTLLAPIGAETAQVLPYTAPATTAAEIAWPGYGASAVGAVGWPGTLASSGSEEPQSIASITKVITALVVLEARPLGIDDAGEGISFTTADVALYNSYLAANGKVVPVRSGITLSQRNVLDLVLVASANNYSASLVNWAFGSEAAFVVAANAWLAEHGLNSTTLSDCTGMSPANQSTASDLVELGKIALADPLVSTIIATTSLTIPQVGVVTNTNDLLGLDGIDGIKTGTLDEAGACLLFAADYLVDGETVTVVGVVLGGVDHPSLDRDIQTLLTGVRAGFHNVELVTAGQPFASYTTDWGATSEVVATEARSVVVWGDTPISLLVHTEKVGVSDAGDDVGALSFAVGNQTVSIPLELKSAIDDPGPWWRLGNPGELF